MDDNVYSDDASTSSHGDAKNSRLKSAATKVKVKVKVSIKVTELKVDGPGKLKLALRPAVKSGGVSTFNAVRAGLISYLSPTKVESILIPSSKEGSSAGVLHTAASSGSKEAFEAVLAALESRLTPDKGWSLSVQQTSLSGFPEAQFPAAGLVAMPDAYYRVPAVRMVLDFVVRLGMLAVFSVVVISHDDGPLTTEEISLALFILSSTSPLPELRGRPRSKGSSSGK